MDISPAIASLGQAITVVKALKELDRSMDAATYKSKIAELYSGLADVKMALSDAREELHGKDRIIQKLTADIEALKSGEVCPICNAGRLKVIASKPHKHFAFAGVQECTLACDGDGCSHRESRMHDPDGRTKRK